MVADVRAYLEENVQTMGEVVCRTFRIIGGMDRVKRRKNLLNFRYVLRAVFVYSIRW